MIWIWRLAVALAVAGAVACLVVGLRNPTPLPILAWPYFLVPIAYALMPHFRRTRGILIAATVLLVVYCFLPWSFSIGIFFWPATITMILASCLPLPRRPLDKYLTK
jgi:hypothetical protein